MKSLLTLILFASASLQAMSLDTLIAKSLQKSPSLEVIQARLQANKQNIAISDAFANPEVVVTKNTIDSNAAMSQTVVTFKQSVPYYSKREKRQGVAVAEDSVLQVRLRQAKVNLVERIKNEAYTIWELRELNKIIDEYIALTKSNITLYESYAKISNAQHMGIMKAELSLSDLQVQKATLASKITAAYARLSYLSALRVSSLEIALKIGTKPRLAKLKGSLDNNPDIQLQNKEIVKQNAKVALASINNYPDFNLIAGYAYREKFDNYYNFGIGVKLPIYGTEDAKEEEARAILLAKKSQKNDTKLVVNSQLEVYYSQMLASYKIYHIIEDEALPQVAHMFEISSASIATGSDLFKYIDVLFQKLDLQNKSIEAVANYKRAEAKISQLRGDLQ